MRILVTGATGFIGYHLAKVANRGSEAWSLRNPNLQNFPRKKLLERGDEVVGLDNINDYYDVKKKKIRY